MARPNKLWFRTARNAWFVTINGKKHNLGPDEKEAKRKKRDTKKGQGDAAPLAVRNALARDGPVATLRDEKYRGSFRLFFPAE